MDLQADFMPSAIQAHHRSQLAQQYKANASYRQVVELNPGRDVVGSRCRAAHVRGLVLAPLC
eukprot:scaffold358912_cov18-Prasinocladus_malaysianus.AAC.1